MIDHLPELDFGPGLPKLRPTMEAPAARFYSDAPEQPLQGLNTDGPIPVSNLWRREVCELGPVTGAGVTVVAAVSFRVGAAVFRW